jgi:hypothetical protein
VYVFFIVYQYIRIPYLNNLPPIFEFNSFLLENKNLTYFFIFILPRLFIASALFLDIVIFHYMYYLYKIIWVVWVPILFRLYFFLGTFWSNEIKMELFVLFDYTLEPRSLIQIDPTVKLHHGMDYYYILLEATVVNEYLQYCLDEIKEKSWVRYFYIFIYSLFLISWGYSLFCRFLNYNVIFGFVLG